ncbi:MAG: hypothetical protein JSR85_07900 [Proteobacteria bacterium]|nr:hypothetical protein [Pseudomonadota bacterium]
MKFRISSLLCLLSGISLLSHPAASMRADDELETAGLLPSKSKKDLTTKKSHLKDFLRKKDYPDAFKSLRKNLPETCPDEEIVDFLMTSNAYPEWDKVDLENKTWVVSKIIKAAKRQDLESFLSQKDYPDAFKSLRKNLPETCPDEEIVDFLMTSNAYPQWDEVDPEDKKWVVAKVTGKPYDEVKDTAKSTVAIDSEKGSTSTIEEDIEVAVKGNLGPVRERLKQVEAQISKYTALGADDFVAAYAAQKHQLDSVLKRLDPKHSLHFSLKLLAKRFQEKQEKIVGLEKSSSAPATKVIEEKKETSQRRKLPPIPSGKKISPSAKKAPSPDAFEEPSSLVSQGKKVEPSTKVNAGDALRHKTFTQILETDPEAAVRKARKNIKEAKGTVDEKHLTLRFNLAYALIVLGYHQRDKIKECYEEAYKIYRKYLPSESDIYESLELNSPTLDRESKPVPLPRSLKDEYIRSGELAYALGHYEEALERLEAGLAIISDKTDFNPQNALRTAALAAWSQAQIDEIEKEKFHIFAATYFESYFKLNPRDIDLDYYVQAANSAWEASKVPLADAWTVFEDIKSRLEIKYQLGEYKFLELFGPFVPEAQKDINYSIANEFFVYSGGKPLNTGSMYDYLVNTVNAANHLYQAHMRSLANAWIAKVTDTVKVTKEENRLKYRGLYERLNTEIQNTPIDDSDVELNQAGYVFYLEPNAQRYVDEAFLAIRNDSFKYASFLADQLVEHFKSEYHEIVDIMAARIRDRIKIQKGK